MLFFFTWCIWSIWSLVLLLPPRVACNEVQTSVESPSQRQERSFSFHYRNEEGGVTAASFLLLLNWPAREISHWNCVTVNLCDLDEREVWGSYHWPAFAAPLGKYSMLQECLCSEMDGDEREGGRPLPLLLEHHHDYGWWWILHDGMMDDALTSWFLVSLPFYS